MSFSNTTNAAGKAYVFMKSIPFVLVALIGVFFAIRFFFKTDSFVKTQGVTTDIDMVPCPQQLKPVRIPTGSQETYINGRRTTTKTYAYEDRVHFDCTRTVEYKVNGETHQIKRHTSTQTAQDKVGEPMTVWYDKTNPSNAKFGHMPAKRIGLLIGVPFLLILFITLTNLLFVSKVKHAGTGMMVADMFRRRRNDRYY